MSEEVPDGVFLKSFQEKIAYSSYTGYEILGLNFQRRQLLTNPCVEFRVISVQNHRGSRHRLKQWHRRDILG